MANTEFNVRIQLKRDTDANWRAKDPQLLAGEVVFVDTNAGEVRTKVGDGTKKYSALPFMDEVLRNLISDNSKPAFYFEGTFSDNLTFTPTSAVADLNTAYEEGRPCFCSFPYASVNIILPLKVFNKDTVYLFCGVLQQDNGAMLQSYVASQNGGTSWSYGFRELADADLVPINVSQLNNDANYLDSDSASFTYVKKTGDEDIKGIKTFESSIVCAMTPGNENHLVNKKYVDDKAGAYLPLAGGKMTGNITMNNKEIIQAAKIGFLRGAYFQASNIQQQNVISALSAGGTPAYLNAYARTPEADDNAMVLANKEYVDKKTTVLLKTWTSADVS